MSVRIVMLGDIVGRPGQQAECAQQVPVIRQRYKPDLILANAENVTNGSGPHARALSEAPRRRH